MKNNNKKEQRILPPTLVVETGLLCLVLDLKFLYSKFCSVIVEYSVMILIGCKRCGCTCSLKYIKKYSSYTRNFPILHSSTRTSVAWSKIKLFSFFFFFRNNFILRHSKVVSPKTVTILFRDHTDWEHLTAPP